MNAGWRRCESWMVEGYGPPGEVVQRRARTIPCEGARREVQPCKPPRYGRWYQVGEEYFVELGGLELRTGW